MRARTDILGLAFYATYRRALVTDAANSTSSLLSGFLGLQSKFKPGRDGIEKKTDRNLYNRVEQYLFGLPRLAKNTAKLFTEFLWYVLALNAAKLMRYSETRRAAAHTNAGKIGFGILQGTAWVFGLVFKITAWYGKCFTSPITSMRDNYRVIAGPAPSGIRSAFAGLLAGAVFLSTCFDYAALATTVFPAIASLYTAIALTVPALVGAKVLLRSLFDRIAARSNNNAANAHINPQPANDPQVNNDNALSPRSRRNSQIQFPSNPQTAGSTVVSVPSSTPPSTAPSKSSEGETSNIVPLFPKGSALTSATSSSTFAPSAPVATHPEAPLANVELETDKGLSCS